LVLITTWGEKVAGLVKRRDQLSLLKLLGVDLDKEFIVREVLIGIMVLDQHMVLI
jgi:hypothetical protein